MTYRNSPGSILPTVGVSCKIYIYISNETKDLDRSNVSNAYVSGMKEELNVSDVQ